MIEKDYIDGEWRIIKYKNGMVIQQRLNKGNINEEEVIIPPSPLEELKKKNSELQNKLDEQKKQLEDTQKSMVEMMNLIAIQGLTPTK